MPRDSNGNYTLPTGNPVIPGTVIESDWANDTLDDIKAELTDSLSRSGKGGMSAPFKIVDGVEGTPGLSFTNEPTSGLFRSATGVVQMSVRGAAKMSWTENDGINVLNGEDLNFYTAADALGGTIIATGAGAIEHRATTHTFKSLDGVTTFGTFSAAGGSVFTGAISATGDIVTSAGNFQTTGGHYRAISSARGYYMERTGAQAMMGLECHQTSVYSAGLYMDTSSNFGFVSANGGGGFNAWRFYTDSTGNVVATGNVSAYSDIRLKKNIEKLTLPKGWRERLDAIRYRRKDTGQVQVGVSAQQLRKILPECVQKGADGKLSVDYGRAALALLLAGD